MKKKVLVTGANGQLGKTFKELFSDNSNSFEFTFVSKTDLDITNISDVDRFFVSNTFHYCINCAAYTNVEQAEKTPEIAYIINSESVKHLAKTCKIHNTILIHISTDYVFDGNKTTPYEITDSTYPINEYGRSKLKGELYIKETHSKHYIIRTSWLYSKKHGKNFYKTILSKVNQAKELKITDAQTGCPTDCESLANFIFNMIICKSPKFGVYHFCDNIEMTWYDFAYSILKENNALHKVKLKKDKNYVTFANRPSYSVLKTTKINGH